MGPLHARRQQRDQLLGQGGIATGGKKQQLPGLQRVVDKGPLVLHRNDPRPLPADGRQRAQSPLRQRQFPQQRHHCRHIVLLTVPIDQ
ncbi:hypothetical protein PKDLPJHF_02306 [Aeromonas veronii]